MLRDVFLLARKNRYVVSSDMYGGLRIVSSGPYVLHSGKFDNVAKGLLTKRNPLSVRRGSGIVYGINQ